MNDENESPEKENQQEPELPCENCEDCSYEGEAGVDEDPEEQPQFFVSADQVFLNMRTEDGQESQVGMDQVTQTIWSILMDIDRRLCELEGSEEEEKSPIITL